MESRKGNCLIREAGSVAGSLPSARFFLLPITLLCPSLPREGHLRGLERNQPTGQGLGGKVVVLAEAKKQILLPGLAEGKAIERQSLLEPPELLFVLAEGEEGDAAFDLGGTFFKNPVGDEVGKPVRLLFCRNAKKGLPRIALLTGKSAQAVMSRDIFPYGMALVALDPALSLFKVHGVGWQIPVDDGMASGVEIQAFLADGGRGQHKGLKGRVEGVAHPVGMQGAFLPARTHSAETQGEAGADRDGMKAATRPVEHVDLDASIIQ